MNLSEYPLEIWKDTFIHKILRHSDSSNAISLLRDRRPLGELLVVLQWQKIMALYADYVRNLQTNQASLQNAAMDYIIMHEDIYANIWFRKYEVVLLLNAEFNAE